MKLYFDGKPVDDIIPGSPDIIALPPGGKKGQILKKKSDDDYDVYWANEIPIYGVTWDGSSNPAFTRIEDAVELANPISAVGSGEGSSPFDSIYPWSGMKTIVDGDNTFVSIPKFWVKVTKDPFTVQISGKEIDGFQVSPAHRDRGDGAGERDVVYIGRYESASDFTSKSGETPKVSTRMNTFRTNMSNLGKEYWQTDFAMQLTIWFLYIVEFANWNSQETIGQGIVNASEIMQTGGTDSMTYHTGRAEGEDGQTAIQYRHIENLWGNIREFRDGIIFSDENICTYNNPANFSDDYNGEGSVVRSIARPTTAGWLKEMGSDEFDPSFVFPSVISGNGTTYLCDGQVYSSGVRGLQVGGSMNDGQNAGLFFIGGGNSPTGTGANIGSRLQKLPNPGWMNLT